MFLKAKRVWSLFARIGTGLSVIFIARKFFKIEAKWCTMGGLVSGDRRREGRVLIPGGRGSW